ncbi:MAG: NAD(P)H-hydrate dehydratase [Chitinophagaceae bacterium]|nr:MAG: NAD(P)H-hydrate dehydratase [Chitinophagaceae bacterium]
METSAAIPLDEKFLAGIVKHRDPASHKGSHGHALLIAGSKGKMGAAVISARACVRTGVGLLSVSVPEEERGILQTAIPEAMLIMREQPGDLNKYDAVGIGPAIGLTEDSLSLLEEILQNTQHPLLLDADALTLLSQHKRLWSMIPGNSILTPHPGEFDRLFGRHDSIEDRNKSCTALSARYPWVFVLKGQHTHIAYNGGVYVNTTGNAGLAKGGSGDALTGMILSLLAQGYSSLHAGLLGVYLHGLAADLALAQQSPESMLATDVIEHMGRAFKLLSNRDQ